MFPIGPGLREECPANWPVSDYTDSDADFPPSTSFRGFSTTAPIPSNPTPPSTLPPPSDLTLSIVPNLPPSTLYLPDFLTPTEESHLLKKVASTPKPHWTQLSHRRLITYPSALTPNNILLNSPPSMVDCPIHPTHAIPELMVQGPPLTAKPRLINEYRPGEGIMPHEDGPAYHPMVATISLGSPIVLDVFEKNEIKHPEGKRVPKWRILQEPRSLLVTTGDLYTSHLHGIAGVEVDEDLGPETIASWGLLGDREAFAEGRNVRGVRISLTYRDVLRVSNLGAKILGRR